MRCLEGPIGSDHDDLPEIHKMTEPDLFTSESITMGHPDKVADQISDAILDDLIKQDPTARVAVETLVTAGLVMIAGEITNKKGFCNFDQVARQTIHDIGYDTPGLGFSSEDIAVLSAVHKQSRDIAQGVDKKGAGDQGMMFGYACKDGKYPTEYMPLPIFLSRKLVDALTTARTDAGEIYFLRPDGKSQVTVEYNSDGDPVRVPTVVISNQHTPEVSFEEGSKARQMIIELIRNVIPAELLDVGEPTTFYINPTGKFEIGGPAQDTGLTGRKIIADTYGGRGRHGGGAFSGKDPSKVDRSAAYMARYIAKNIVAAGLADICEVQLAYAIGVDKPSSVRVETQGSCKQSKEELGELVRRHFPQSLLTPEGIIEKFTLRRDIYLDTAKKGHFGRPDLPWEETDMVDVLRGREADENDTDS